jgi:hypothetical protein
MDKSLRKIKSVILLALPLFLLLAKAIIPNASGTPFHCIENIPLLKLWQLLKEK